MDLLTQIALGAVVGEAVAGRSIGRKALLAGAVAGAIPDIDVTWGYFLSDVARFTDHRGWTHSLLFAPLSASLLAWLFSRPKPCFVAPFATCFYLFFWCFVTHIGLDLCTTYGTRIFLPLSDEPYALSSIFVVDPLYTVPLLLTVGVLLATKNSVRKNFYIAMAGLLLSNAYLGTSLLLKDHATKVFQNLFASHCPEVKHYLVQSGELTTLMWRVIGMTATGYAVGRYSLLKGHKAITLKFFPYHELRPWVQGESLRLPELEKLLRFSKGFYKLESQGQELYLIDLRFPGNHPFRFAIADLSHGTPLPETPIRRDGNSLEGRGLSVFSLWLMELFGKFPQLAAKNSMATVVPGGAKLCLEPTPKDLPPFAYVPMDLVRK